MRKGTSTRGALGGVVLALLTTGLLSGCLGTDPVLDPEMPTVDEGPTADVVAPDGRDLRTELTADDALPAPAWSVGDWWGIHVYFGSQGGEGRHIDVVVTGTSADGFLLTTADRQAAKEHAVYDLPILGTIGKADLAMTGLGGAWDWFAFPLTDGARWQGEMPNIAFDVLPGGQVPVTFTASFVDDLDVEGSELPGYRVEGRTEGGDLLIEYTYAPSVRWLTSATVYDIDPGQDPIELTIALMGYGRGWTGTYYLDEARVLLENVDGSGLDDAPPDGQPFAQVSPHVAFTVSQDATYLFGFLENDAVAGTRQTLLVPPDGEPRRYEAVGAPEQFTGFRIDEPAMPGEWRLVTAGAGGFSFSYALLAEIVETTGSL